MICVMCYNKGSADGFRDGFELGKRFINKHKEKCDFQCKFCNYHDKKERGE